MEDAKYQIYCHRNKINGKMYIGATKNTWESRWKDGYKDNLHFRRAIEKYKDENWEHYVLSAGLSREEAAEREKAYIDFFKTRDSTVGYNKGRGGEGLMPLDSLYSVQHSREYHDALSEAMKKVWEERTPEQRAEHIAKLSKGLSERSKAIWQREEYREKIMSYYRRKREEHENDPEYIKQREAAKERRKEKQRRYRKEHYVRVPQEVAHEHRSKAAKMIWEKDPIRKAVFAAKVKERWNDSKYREKISENARNSNLGIDHTEAELSAIVVGMKEKWKDPAFRDSLCKKRPPRTEEQKEAARIAQGQKNGKSILCVETGVTYASFAAAAREFGKDRKKFATAIKGQKTAYGYHWIIMEETEKAREREVICVETGKRYTSMRQAQKETGICASSICGVCQGRRKVAGGYHWQYAEEQIE